MMRVLLALIFVSYAFCARSQDSVPEEWQVSTKQAQKMVRYFNDCTEGCQTSRVTSDTLKEQALRSIFKEAKSIEWVAARYTKDDVARYAARKGSGADKAESQVQGYATQLLKITTVEGKEMYFDIVTLCPPPTLCDESKTDANG